MAEQPRRNRLDTLALCLAAGWSLRRSAAAAKMARRTARYHAARPYVKARVTELREQMLGQALGILTRGAVKAARAQVKLLNDPSADVRQRAVSHLFEKLLAVRLNHDQAARLAAMEGTADDPD